MKAGIFFIVVLLGIGSCTRRQQKSDDQAAIRKVLETQRQAWNRGDLEAYMAGYIHSDSLLFVGSRGPQYGWDKTLAGYKKSYPDKEAMGHLTFDIMQVKLIDDDHAFVLGGWNLKRKSDNPRGYFTLLMIRTNAEWKVAVDHSS